VQSLTVSITWAITLGIATLLSGNPASAHDDLKQLIESQLQRAGSQITVSILPGILTTTRPGILHSSFVRLRN
jgi:hypothetical protein